VIVLGEELFHNNEYTTLLVVSYNPAFSSKPGSFNSANQKPGFEEEAGLEFLLITPGVWPFSKIKKSSPPACSLRSPQAIPKQKDAKNAILFRLPAASPQREGLIPAIQA
jgi:hypothetical protein